MNWDQVEGSWKQTVGRAKQKWGRLSDDQLTEIGGRKDRLIGKIQEIYGTTKDDAEHQVDEWLSGLDSSRNAAQGAMLDAAGEWWEDTRRSLTRGAEAMSAVVEERPLFALSCAVGIGIILGLALSRR